MGICRRRELKAHGHGEEIMIVIMEQFSKFFNGNAGDNSSQKGFTRKNCDLLADEEEEEE